MKKWLLGLSIFVALLVLAAYVIIPGKITVSSIILARANPHGAYRCLTDYNKWTRIFGKQVAENSFRFHDITFAVNKRLADAFQVTINHNGVTDSSLIELVRLNNDSSVIRWTFAAETSSNPVQKVKKYFAARSMKKEITSALDTMKRFLEKEENVYGIGVKRTTVKDTILIVIKKTFNNYPSSYDIYGLIGTLQNYASAGGAGQSGYPMLDVKSNGSSNFQAMVALPINKELPDHGEILHKEMVPGNILFTEVTGGTYTVTKAFNSLADYVADHDLQSPAIPFQSLITDRLQQPDTTKWLTKIYYPIY